MSKKPVIGLIASHDLTENRFCVLARYTDAVENSGGIPVILPLSQRDDCTKKYAEMCDGVIFPGGVDLDPKSYNEEKHEKCGEITPLRDVLEIKLANLLYELDKPLFGVCRGIQAMAVAFGGTLYQDIPSEYDSTIIHRQQPPYSTPTHTVKVGKDSLLYRITGREELSVNSMHHQSIKDKSERFSLTAFAPDGIVEAMEVKGMSFGLGVQWHPEHLYSVDPAAKALFDAFIASC